MCNIDQDDIIKLARQIWGERAILPVGGLVTFFHAAQKLGAEQSRAEIESLRRQVTVRHDVGMRKGALLRECLYALEYASDMTKPEGLSGCDCPICTSIANIKTELREQT